MHKALFFSLALTVSSFSVSEASAKDFYVSIKRGKGKKGTQSKPAKDLGNIIKKLKPGDTVHIAEGTYLGRGRSGTNVITVPVNIKCGYSDDFKKRDPWGKHRTILSGDNKSKNWKQTWTLGIDLMKYRKKEMPKMVIDGCIIDNSGRNNYADKSYAIIRRATPKRGAMPTPDSPALMVRASKTGNFDAKAHWDITVKNNIVVNSGSRTPLAVSGYKNSKLTIENNCVINSSGGIYYGTKFRPRDGKHKVSGTVRNNTVLFSWMYDGMTSDYSGYGFKCDPDTIATVENNVFGVSQYVAVDNTSKCSVLLRNNLIFGARKADYLEFSTFIGLSDIEDEAELLHDDSENNVTATPKIPVSKTFADLMASVVVPDRAKIESKVKAANSGANALRRILGLPLQGGTVKGPSVPVWLPKMSVNDAISACGMKYEGKYGSSKPKR